MMMQMGFNARRVLTVLKTIVWLSVMSNFLLLGCKGIQSDIDCLKSIKHSLEDPLGYLSSWNFNNDTEAFICKFTGIECWHSDESKVLNIRLSDMGLKGPFPPGLANCSALTGLDLSSNQLSGTIPSNISELIPFITSLDLSSNNFNGEIPPDIANLSYIIILKLDSNQLTGHIPPVVGQLSRIKTMSVANNHLSGPVPDFANDYAKLYVSAESYANNPGLCGIPLPPCKNRRKNINHHAFFISGFAVGWSISTVFAFALALFYLPDIPLLKKIVSSISSRKKKKNNKRNNQQLVQPTPSPTTKITSEVISKISKLEKLVTRISFTELLKATDNFSEDSIIGFGKKGTMYKALLPNGWSLAIKRFYDSQSSESEEHFVSEVTTLGRLRHINLVPLIGFCHEINDKLLVYKYMPNGNLYDWLHPPEGEPKIMKWPVRVKIAIGLARGLAWLHHHNNKFQVFHHNISSKCVLLDQNFEPKISNFGEAKFIILNDQSVSGWSFSINGEVLELGFDKNDVYSFGVMLLELVTGKEPNKAAATDTSSATCDSSLIGLGFDGEIFEFLSIASRCVQSFPEQRPTMLQVYQRMRAIGKRHGLVDDSEMWKQIEITTASGGDVEIIE